MKYYKLNIYADSSLIAVFIDVIPFKYKNQEYNLSNWKLYLVLGKQYAGSKLKYLHITNRFYFKNKKISEKSLLLILKYLL